MQPQNERKYLKIMYVIRVSNQNIQRTPEIQQSQSKQPNYKMGKGLEKTTLRVGGRLHRTGPAYRPNVSRHLKGTEEDAEVAGQKRGVSTADWRPWSWSQREDKKSQEKKARRALQAGEVTGEATKALLSQVHRAVTESVSLSVAAGGGGGTRWRTSPQLPTALPLQ